jgi:membrane protein YqaA with SNARE-associated domain
MDWPLFLSAFLSATLLPGSSEAVLMLRLSGGGDPWPPVAVATAGNLLGSLVTYGIGRAGNRAVRAWRWLGVNEAGLARAERWFGRWGRPGLLLAWLPVVGDPLCLLAGLMRVELAIFVLLVGSGKALRYAALAWMVA